LTDNHERNAEFARTTTAAECRTQVAQAMARAEADLQQLQEGAGRSHPARARLHGGISDDHAVLLHVLEELFQHLGQMEVTKDVLLLA